METDLENFENIPPIMEEKTAVELTDYHCPFCNFKLFRGHVTDFNMVCSQCNKLVRSAMISPAEKDPES
jgi:uncharacterized Zn finger protein (UPF0148 family)